MTTGRAGPGRHVLINGAGGGAGTLAVQMAKALGAQVTAVDAAAKLDMLRELGADHVLDYEAQDYTRTGTRYDLILDLAGYRSIVACSRALEPGGTYLLVGGATSHVAQTLVFGPLMRVLGKRMKILGVRPNQDLDEVARQLVAGELTPAIDKTFPLEQAAEAIRYVGEGRAVGKVVLTV